MLHRIVMNIIQVTSKIHFVPDGVLPESLLPKFHATSDADRSFVGFGEVGLEGVHDLAKVAVLGWLDEQMEMVGHKDVAQHRKRVQFFDPSQR